MRSNRDEIWRFDTARFGVVLSCEYEQDPDLSWADSEVLEKLESGAFVNLCFFVTVYLDGAEVAETSLGNSIHESADYFRDHIGINKRASLAMAKREVRKQIAEYRKRAAYLREKIAPMQRGYGRGYYERSMESARASLAEAKRKLIWARQYHDGAAVCGSYFSQMVREAVSDARKAISARPYLRTIN